MTDTVGTCPVCGAVGGEGLAQAPALLAVCDVLVVRALEMVGRHIVRLERSRFKRMGHRPMHEAHTLWPPRDDMVAKSLRGAWDVIPAMLDNHGCCGVTSAQVTAMVDSYVKDLLVSSTAHNLSDLRYRFERYLGIPLAEPAPYAPEPEVLSLPVHPALPKPPPMQARSS